MRCDWLPEQARWHYELYYASAIEYMKDHIFELWTKIWRQDWSSLLYTTFRAVVKSKAWKKIQARTEFEPMICSALPTELYIKDLSSQLRADHVVNSLLIRNITVDNEEFTSIYEISYSWTAEKDMKTLFIIAVIGTQLILKKKIQAERDSNP